MLKIVSSKALSRSIGIALALLILKTSVAQEPLSARKSPTATRSIERFFRLPSSAKPRAIPSQWKKKRTIALNRIATDTSAGVSSPSAAALLPIVERAALSEEHKQLANRLLRALPAGCRDHLQNFYALYDGNARRRGLGGKTTIILDGSVSDAEFGSLLVHECGHVIHGNLTGTPAADRSTFRDGQDVFFADAPAARFFAISWTTQNVLHAGTAEKDFVSGYAGSDAFEDFAETFAAYALHRSPLRARAAGNAAIAAKLAWMERELPLPENALGESAYVWNGTVPWDVTRLPISLLAY